METKVKTIENITKSEFNEEAVFEGMVIGSSISLKKGVTNKSYFAFDPNNPEIIVEVENYPGFNVDYEERLIDHWYHKNIPVSITGGSKEGKLYIKEASKTVHERKITLVSSSPQGFLNNE